MWNPNRRFELLFFGLICLLCVVPGSSAQVQDQRSASGVRKILKYYELSPIYQKWIDEDVRWIITDQERADFPKLTTDEQRDKFVEDFWERRNPDPGSEENKFKQEHYRRLAYANEQFAADVAGWKTDRGRIYIIYGPPDQREQHPGTRDTVLPAGAPDSVRYPLDIWRYRSTEGVGNDAVFEFIDTCRCGIYQLRDDPDRKVPLPTKNKLWIRM